MIRISFLITHYNRLDDLLNCLGSIKKVYGPNDEIVVSDDCSSDEVIETLKNIPSVRLIPASKNIGLAGNLNKGLKACTGKFIIYCQEDFVLNPELKFILPELITILEERKLDLIRFSSNFVFNKVKKIDSHVSLIPKFSIANFHQNFYRYSDHPFFITSNFHNTYGYYLEGTSGRYGETEYCMRIANSNAKIGITNMNMASNIAGSHSTLIHEVTVSKYRPKINKRAFRLLRALRLYFEWNFYRKTSRGLITYKNARVIK